MKRNMAHKESFALPLALLLASSFGVSLAQTPASRVAGDWRNSESVPLAASQPPVPVNDLGPAPSGMRMDRMLLLLEPSAAQQGALIAKLDSLQNPASTQYHRWLSPPAFADDYSNSAADAAAVADWLASEGFHVAPLPAGRGWIEFSGTAAQVEAAFQTRVHLISTENGPRAALAASLSVPSAFAPLVHGLVSLDGVLSSPAVTLPRPVSSSAAQLRAETAPARAEALTPLLAAQMLRLDALHAAGQTGTGEVIAIPARSHLRTEDVAAFRAAFGLPARPLIVYLNGTDPGHAEDETAAVLAASWVGVAAPGAQIVVVPVATTAATDGLDLALAATVDQALALTVSVGYSACEAALSETHRAFYAALYRQAAAEGIAVIAATGDSGPAACHTAGADAQVTTGFGVNALAATPWNTAVGVSSFAAEGSSSASAPMAAWSQANPADPVYAGGGGRSSIYAGPSWQPVPSGAAIKAASQPVAPREASAPTLAERFAAGLGTGNRLLPDIALPTAIDSGLNRGLALCLSGGVPSRGCTLVRAGGSAGSAALFAGIAALLAEKYGPQGNLAPNLYALSRRSGVFTDVQQGSAEVRCAAGTPGCGPTGQIGFPATAGYDLATGLGTVNAQALVGLWRARPMVGTDSSIVSLVISPLQLNSTYNPSAQVTLSANVLSLTGHGQPTGTVTFFDNSTGAVIGSPVTLDANGNAVLTTEGLFSLGGNEMVAIYSGDATYASRTSTPPVNVNVQLSTTSLAVVPSNFNPASGEVISVTVTLTVGSPPAGTVAPTGQVTLNLDGLPTTAAQLSTTGGVTSATMSLTVPVSSSLHAHALQATYIGNGNYSASTSPPVTINVAKSATTSTVIPATTTPYAGSSLVLNATVAASATGATSPSGTFDFTLDGVLQGTAVLVPGSPSTATLAITVPSPGAHAVGGSYGGDANNAASTAASVNITVSKSPTTLLVTPATSTPAPGVPLQVTATLAAQFAGPTAPTGSVTLTLDGSTQGTSVLLSGTTATFTITSPSAGLHTLQASYGGDGNYATSTSPVVNITVAKVATTTVVTPATTTPAAGTPLVVTANVSTAAPGTTQPSGTVTFTLDGTSVGIGALTPGSPSTASITIATLASGTHVLQATYGGDSYYSTSIAPAVTLVIAKSPTTTVVTPATVTPTAGGTVQVTASITATSPGATPPSGTVSFALDGVSQGVQAVTPGSPSSATFTLPVLTAGTHVLVGTYSGDASYATSISAPVTLVVAKGATVVTVAATPSTLTVGSPESFSATVAPINPVTGTIYTITGTVSFYDGGSTLLGRAVISNNVATLSGITLSGSVNHTITAIYSGDTNWLASTSTGLLLLSITQPDTVVLTANITTVLPGQPAILVATVTPVSIPALTSEQNPTGNVVFYNGTTILGTVALVPSVLNDSSSATLTISLPGGQDVLTAFYVGDLFFDAGTSNPITLDVEDFTITPGPTNPPGNLTIVKGSSGTAAFVITGLGGFNGQIQVVCAVPSQDDMTCTASPQQVTPQATVTFVVQTFGSGNTTASNRMPPALWPRAAGGTALAVLGFFLLPFGRRARVFTGRGARRLLVLLLLLTGLGTAGIGCNSVTMVSSPGTPLGVATLKVTASAYVDNTVVSRSLYLTVNVIPKP